MLNVLCYTAGLILLVLAAVLPANVQRDRLAYAGLAFWLLPTTVHALQNH
jgi:acid stress-induced BolA-like protein IbaG/YrbA